MVVKYKGVSAILFGVCDLKPEHPVVSQLRHYHLTESSQKIARGFDLILYGSSLYPPIYVISRNNTPPLKFVTIQAFKNWVEAEYAN